MNRQLAIKMTRHRRGIRRIKNEQQEILDRLGVLQEQIDAIRESVLQNSSESNRKTRRRTKSLTIDGYKTFFSWQDKIVFILKYRSKPMLSSEIVSFMDGFDTVFQDKETQLDKMKMLSTHLNRTIKKGIITRFKQNGVKGYYYWLPENPNEYTMRKNVF